MIQMTSNGPGHSISCKTTNANAQADQSHCFALISQTSQLSLDECWAHMQSCRKCCASTEISESLLAGFILIKFLVTPVCCLFSSVYTCITIIDFYYQQLNA